MAVVEGPTILAGQSLSDAVNLGTSKLMLVISPPEWNSANISFEVSIDGGAFYPLYRDGVLLQMACKPDWAMIVDAQLWPKDVWIKFKSGHVDNMVIQSEDRHFKLLVEG